jgi:hypothetical protein
MFATADQLSYGDAGHVRWLMALACRSQPRVTVEPCGVPGCSQHWVQVVTATGQWMTETSLN